MSDDFLDYPKGRISQGSGDLQDVSTFTLTYSDGEKHVNTLRKSGAGSTSGPRNCTLQFTIEFSERGLERDYMKNYRKRKVLQYRLKVPGQVLVINGRLSNPSLVSNVDGQITMNWTLIGKDMSDQ